VPLSGGYNGCLSPLDSPAVSSLCLAAGEWLPLNDLMSDQHSITRRDFLGAAFVGAASVAAGPAETTQRPNAPTGLRVVAGGPQKALLQFSDFEYVGGFNVPSTSGGLDTRFGRGLAHRYVGGDLRFLSAGHKTPSSPATARDGEVFEFGFPDASPRPPFPTAPILRHWGDIYQNMMFVGTPEGKKHWILRDKPRGLWWDEQGQRLYWSYSCGGEDAYCALPESCTLGASVLDSTTGRGRGIGAWRIRPAPYKCVIRGCVPIPPWFAQAYTGGRRIAAGFGGTFSMMTTGGVSHGPSLWAIDPPAAPHLAAIDATTLVSYHPPNLRPYTRPLRCQRPADYRTKLDGWQVRNGIGYWSWTDEIYQGCVWIDLPDKHGVLFFPVLGHGLLYYANGATKAEKALHWWMALDPNQLARVAQGALARDQVVPAWWQQVNYPLVPYPTGSGWQSDWPLFYGRIPRVIGSTFDPTTRTLFVMLMTKPWPQSVQTVFAYRVK
jgi:hypothetical protein